MKSRANLVSLGLILLSFAASAVFYNRLPDLVPTHWNVQGQPNGFTPKPWGPFLLPIITLGLYVFLKILPRISPRGFGIKSFSKTYEVLVAAIVGFCSLIHLFGLLAGTGVHIRIDQVTSVALGFLLIVLGNFMGKLRKNFFVGIRTPWTLANDEVWFRTHRLGGKLSVLAGVMLIAAAFMGIGLPTMIFVPIALAIVTTVSSYIIYKRVEETPKPLPTPDSTHHAS